jgi:HlyD family secretion protein
MAKKKSNLLKWLLITVAVLIVFAIVGKKAGWIGGAEQKEVAVEKAEKRNIVETVSASGKIQPEVSVKISPDVSGEIVELPVKEGDRVKKGQLLVRILPDIYQSYVDRSVAALNGSKANLENAKSRLVQARSQFDKARQAYDRSKKLYDEKLISPQEWEGVKSAYEVAQAEVAAAGQSVSASDFSVRSAEASLKEARDNLRKTTIYAPVDGTISKLNVEKGERVVGTSQMAGTEMMTLADLNEMEVSVDVNENDIVRVNTGDTATIEVDAYLGKKFKGVVTEVANSANITGISVDQVTNFSVKVRILRESYEQMADPEHPDRSVFHPGMSATVDIMTRRVSDVISVPIQSVTTRDTTMKEAGQAGTQRGNDKLDDESEITVKDEKAEKAEKAAQSGESDQRVECVFLLDGNKVRLVPVKTGIQDNSYIEIKSGLKAGDQVVSSPYSAIAKFLKDGDPVKVVPKDQLFNKKN